MTRKVTVLMDRLSHRPQVKEANSEYQGILVKESKRDKKEDLMKRS